MVKIIRIEEAHGFDEGNNLVKRYAVKWRTDAGDGPFVTHFPIDGFDEWAAKAQLETQAAKFAALRGQ